MPSFANPFQGNIDRMMTNQELAQAIRLDIASELEAIYLYDAHATATTDLVAKKVLADIRDEEVAHVGELMALLRYLDPTVADLLAGGESEVKAMIQELGIDFTPKQEKAEDTTMPISIGSLIGK